AAPMALGRYFRVFPALPPGTIFCRAYGAGLSSAQCRRDGANGDDPTSSAGAAGAIKPWLPGGENAETRRGARASEWLAICFGVVG
ncbi:MAG: hypothetical protein WA744_02680, partial [Candidatus Acidiferrales bacterium]